MRCSADTSRVYFSDTNSMIEREDETGEGRERDRRRERRREVKNIRKTLPIVPFGEHLTGRAGDVRCASTVPTVCPVPPGSLRMQQSKRYSKVISSLRDFLPGLRPILLSMCLYTHEGILGICSYVLCLNGHVCREYVHTWVDIVYVY